LDDGGSAKAIVHFGNGVLHKKKLFFPGGGQPSLPASAGLCFVFVPNRFFNPLGSVLAAPGRAKGGIGYDNTHGLIREAVFYHGILKTDVPGILPLDQHIGKADGIGLWVYFMPEKPCVNIGIETVEKIVRGGEHTAGSTDHIQHGSDLALGQKVVAALGKDDVHHEPNHFTRRVVIASLGVGGKAADKVLKHIAHHMAVHGLGIKIKFAEFFYHPVEAVVLVHLLNFFFEFEIVDDFLNVDGKAFDVAFKIRGDIFAVRKEFRKRKAAGVIKGETGLSPEHSLRGVGVLFKGRNYRRFGWGKGALQAADDYHGDNNVFVFVG
jgi:hypothetical protein